MLAEQGEVLVASAEREMLMEPAGVSAPLAPEAATSVEEFRFLYSLEAHSLPDLPTASARGLTGRQVNPSLKNPAWATTKSSCVCPRDVEASSSLSSGTDL